MSLEQRSSLVSSVSVQLFEAMGEQGSTQIENHKMCCRKMVTYPFICIITSSSEATAR